MKAIERAAIVRVLTDLIKADKVIDSREMSLYKNIKSKFAITRKDEVDACALTLSDAVSVISNMERGFITDLLGTFEDMSLIDGFCAREEALLLLTLHLCLNPSGIDADVISAAIEEDWFDENQVLYVESHHAKDVNFAISSNIRHISRELKMCGLDFVFLPQVIQHYIFAPRETLNEVIAMLSPSLSEEMISGLLTKIKLFKTDSFCIEQLHHKLGLHQLADTPPALLFRISQSKVDNALYTNFLRVELTADVLNIVQKIVDVFLSFNGSDNITISHKKDEKGSFLYNGFYRQLFELLLLQKSVTCHLLIDLVHQSISFPEIDVALSSLHRKEKALFTLFIYEAYNMAIRSEDGTIRQNGGINFSAPESARSMPRFNRRMELLQRKYAVIYAAFGGNPDKAPKLVNDKIRNPMICGIRRAVNSQSKKIYDAESFSINRDKSGIYGIYANPELFLCKDFQNPDAVSFFETSLFNELSSLK